jgi:hypothetical protein
MAFFVNALVLAVAALSLKSVRFLTVAAWIIAVLFAVPHRRSALQARLGELDVAAAAGRCRPLLYLEVRRRRRLSKAAHRHRDSRLARLASQDPNRSRRSEPRRLRLERPRGAPSA